MALVLRLLSLHLVQTLCCSFWVETIMGNMYSNEKIKKDYDAIDALLNQTHYYPDKKGASKDEAAAILTLHKRISYQYHGIMKDFEEGMLGYAKGIGFRYEYLDTLSLCENLEAMKFKLQGYLELHGIPTQADKTKPHRIFISHAEIDEPYVLAIVELIEAIGVPEDGIICTSVPPYGAKYGDNIYDWLRLQFTDCKLHVLFVLSDHYYKSAACLNEMGAAWITQSKANFILLPGFEYKEIKGAIDPRVKGMKLDGKQAETESSLIELRDSLINEFKLSEISEAKWKRKTEEFFRKINAIIPVTDMQGDRKDQYAQASIDNTISKVSTDDEKIALVYILERQVCNIDVRAIEQWLLDEELYGVNVHNAFTLLADWSGGKYDGERLAFGISLFRELIQRKNDFIGKYLEVLDNHRIRSSEVFKNLWDAGKLNNEDKLFAGYVIEKHRTEFGDRWMAREQIEDIKLWERETGAGELLSSKYGDVLNFYIENHLVYASDWTSYGNPKEYTLCRSLKDYLFSDVFNKTDEINEIKLSEFLRGL